MTNGTDYGALYDPANVTVANGTLTVDPVQETDAFSTTNTQENAFQFGTTTPSDRPVEVSASLPNAFDGETPVPFQNYGIYVGDGTQSNYTKLVVGARSEDDAVGEVELLSEEDDQVAEAVRVPDSAVVGGDVDLYLTIDPTTDPTPNDGSDDVALTAEYAVDGGERTQVGDGAVPIPAAWLADSDGGLAVGVINTAAGSGETYAATYDSLAVEALEPTADGPPALPGFENAPTDPDGDGVYEDVNGNGAVTLADVTALFANTDSAAVTENPAAFDVNGNDEFTLADVTALFEAAGPPPV
jgi:PKD repeat protein